MKGLNVSEYDLKRAKGKIYTIREVEIPPFMTTVVKGITNLITHSKCMNVLAKPVIGYADQIATARLYVVLKPGRGKKLMFASEIFMQSGLLWEILQQ